MTREELLQQIEDLRAALAHQRELVTLEKKRADQLAEQTAIAWRVGAVRGPRPDPKDA